MAMSNIRLQYDLGNAARVYAGGKVFKKKDGQPSIGVANYTLQSGDQGYYSSYTFRFDDLNIDGGSFHRTWTASEMAVVNLPGNSGVYYTYSGNNTDIIYTATVAGRLRLSGPNNRSYCYYYINGVSVLYAGGSFTAEVNARCLALSPGQYVQVTIPSGEVHAWYWKFLPEVYTT